MATSYNARRTRSLPRMPQTDDLLSWDEAERVLAQAEPSARDFAWMTVQRRLSLSTGQVSSLTVNSYDPETGILATKARNGEALEYRNAATCRAALDRWLAVRSTLRTSGDPAMFVSREGRLSDRHIRNMVKRYALAAGITRNVHPDSLRQPTPADHPAFHLPTEGGPPPAVFLGVGGGASVQPLAPFRPKADTEYLVEIEGGTKARSRHHETLVNDFAGFLRDRGLEPQRSLVIDLALSDPPVIVEAKYVDDAADWTRVVREAVSQLYEYRFFEVVDPRWPLALLASGRVPDRLMRYLEDDRDIAVVWRGGDRFVFSGMARSRFRMAPQ